MQRRGLNRGRRGGAEYLDAPQIVERGYAFYNGTFCPLAHNGANFDFYLLYKDMTEDEIIHSPINLRGTSIIEFQFCGHVFKDTWAGLPSKLYRSKSIK